MRVHRGRASWPARPLLRAALWQYGARRDTRARGRGRPGGNDGSPGIRVRSGMSGSPLGKRVKTALDETRLLILGAQVLFGFHLNGAFQKEFPNLSTQSRVLHA